MHVFAFVGVFRLRSQWALRLLGLWLVREGERPDLSRSAVKAI